MKWEEVAIVDCSSYSQKEVDEAVKKLLDLLNFEFKKGSKILIKPNVVGCFPRNQIAITTNPAIVKAVCKILTRKKCKIFIGDSPFTNPDCAFESSGINKLEKYGKIVVFEREKLVKIRDAKAKVLKEFEIAKLVKDVDLIINMPKLKTHTLTSYTGAIKNIYGVIPGGLKQRLHNHAQGEKKFSKMLVDIYQNIKPELTIMDAVVGMDKQGPSAGAPRKVGLILASRNGVSLDIAAAKMIGFNPKNILMINEAVKRKLASYNIELAGKNPGLISFRKPNSFMRLMAKGVIKRLFKEKPIVVDKIRCEKCGLCAKHCPGKAISMPFYPEIDKKKCIRCFCCIEICPNHALSLKH